MRTLTRHRSIVVFLLIAAIAVSYGAVTYVKLPRLLGIGRYAVTVELPDGAGLYPNSIVTVRGVQVGQVDAVRLTPLGAAADMQIDDGVTIPADAAVEVRATSAVGEQYLDFAPRGAGPALREGSVVPASRVALPVPTADLLDRADRLVASVPRQKLNRTIDEVHAAFGGAGGDLQRLLRAAEQFQSSADANLGPTAGLLGDLPTVLRTQAAQAGNTRSALRDLAAVTGTLRDGDADLRGTLHAFPPFLDEFGKLLDGVRPTLPVLLRDLTSVGQVVRVYLPNVAQTVTILQPTLNASVGAVVNSPLPAASKIDFDLVVNDPPPCTTGFELDRRSPADLSPARPATNAYCRVPNDSPQAVRGGRNYQCPPGAPIQGRSITAAGCGLNFQSPKDAAAATEAAIQTQLRVAATNPKTNAEDDLRPPQYPDDGPNTNPDGDDGASVAAADSGVFGLPGAGGPAVLGNAVPTNRRGWQGFLTNPLGLGAG